ncbi:MAG: phage terminase large subunit family protein [Fidelibacterota bacterium]|nr:MAG: phage terminase large subunit family protein [Candidatus Neomarinimicrobiota bacterium]
MMASIQRACMRPARSGQESGEGRMDFRDFLKTHIRTDEGTYGFERHGPLKEIAQRLPEVPELWVLKGAQVGLSTLVIGWCLYLARIRGYNVGYALPTKIFARRFLKTRFREVTASSAHLKRTVRTTENIGLMAVAEYGEERKQRTAYLYMLGMENISDAISIPLDALAFDEVDVLNQENMAWADDRIAASRFGQRLYFSVGMHPGLGIDAGYERTTQQVWVVRCPACRKDDQVLEELFPACVKRVDGKWQRICVGCGRPLDIQQAGRWVARHPGRDIEGYRVPQLIIPGVSLGYIMGRWARAQQRRSLLAKFRSSTLALPDAGERQRITAERLTGVLADYPMKNQAEWTVGGADVGDTCHVAFADLTGERLRFVRLEAVSSDRMVAEMSGMITAMGCRCFVIDAKPFRSEVRRLARRHPEVVVLQYFKDQGFGTGTETHEGYTYRTVSEAREDSLDSYCDLFDPEREGVLFPRYLGGGDLMDSEVAAHHLKGSQKVDQMDQRLGKSVPRFRKGVDNHYLMACNNARKALMLLATGRGAQGVGVLPVFGGG